MKEKIKELQIHDKDTGSSEVQIAQLTGKIESLSKHMKQFKKDKHSSVGLLRAVNRRKKLLDYLKRNNMEAYKAMVGEIQGLTYALEQLRTLLEKTDDDFNST